jgi:hypothetical protein
MLNIVASDSRPAKLRSRFTNDPSFLPGVDRRTRDGRRYQDIVLALVAEFSPANPVSLREIARLRFSLERAQGEIVAGGGCLGRTQTGASLASFRLGRWPGEARSRPQQ